MFQNFQPNRLDVRVLCSHQFGSSSLFVTSCLFSFPNRKRYLPVFRLDGKPFLVPAMHRFASILFKTLLFLGFFFISDKTKAGLGRKDKAGVDEGIGESCVNNDSAGADACGHFFLPTVHSRFFF